MERKFLSKGVNIHLVSTALFPNTFLSINFYA